MKEEEKEEERVTTQSFSLVSTLRIPNLGHTDTNAISVPARVSRRGREEGGRKRVAEFEPGWSESYESAGYDEARV